MDVYRQNCVIEVFDFQAIISRHEQATTGTQFMKSVSHGRHGGTVICSITSQLEGPGCPTVQTHTGLINEPVGINVSVHIG